MLWIEEHSDARYSATNHLSPDLQRFSISFRASQEIDGIFCTLPLSAGSTTFKRLFYSTFSVEYYLQSRFIVWHHPSTIWVYHYRANFNNVPRLLQKYHQSLQPPMLVKEEGSSCKSLSKACTVKIGTVLCRWMKILELQTNNTITTK